MNNVCLIQNSSSRWDLKKNYRYFQQWTIKKNLITNVMYLMVYGV